MPTAPRNVQREAKKLLAHRTADALAEQYSLVVTARFPWGMAIGPLAPNLLAAFRCAPEVEWINHNTAIEVTRSH